MTVENTDLCSRYCARVVKNIKIEPSPKWLQRRLSSVGIRPINNLVDITNYVMEEYGQPMHAYDYDTIAGHKIVVRTATDGEKFVTLDGQERTLDAQTLLICDGEKPGGIAGAYIFGLPESKVEKLTFENINFSYAKDAKPGVAAMMLGCDASSKRGIVAANVKKLKLFNVSVNGAEGEPYELINVDSVVSK